MPEPHDRIIARAAKVALEPLKFSRKGRSRLWFADQGWWLTVVEFQPSGWSKGTYLNVAAHWLWSDNGHLSFDFGDRAAGFEEYVSDEQFAVAASRLADRAASEAQRLAQVLIPLSATADVLLDAAQAMHEQGRIGWMTYHAGVAAGLVNRSAEATEMFEHITSSSAPPSSNLLPAAERMARIVSEPSGFRREVSSRIERQRRALGLTTLDTPPI